MSVPVTWEFYDISGQLHIYHKKSNRLLRLGLVAEPYNIRYSTGFNFNQVTDANRVDGDNLIINLMNRGYAMECSNSNSGPNSVPPQPQMTSSPRASSFMNTNRPTFGETGEEEEPEAEGGSFNWPVPTSDPIPIEEDQGPRPALADGFVRCTAEFSPTNRMEFVLRENLAKALIKKDASLFVKECSKDAPVRYEMVEKIMTEVAKESASLCSKTNGSVFMDTHVPLLSSDQMANAAKQIESNAPLTFKLLTSIGCTDRPTRIIDPAAWRGKLENCVVVSAAILLKCRNNAASAFQTQLTQLVKNGGLHIRAINQLQAFNITLHNNTVTRMWTNLWIGQQQQNKLEPNTTYRKVPILECGVCFRKFSTKQALGSHVLHVHKRPISRKKPKVCEICKATFCNGSNLNRHMKGIHKKE